MKLKTIIPGAIALLKNLIKYIINLSIIFFEQVIKTIKNPKHIIEVIKNFKIRNLFAKKNLKVLITVIVLFFIVFGVKKIFFSKKKDKPADTLIQVKVAKTKKEKYTEPYSVMGTIKGAVENDLRFEIEGNLQRYNFNEGAHISKGQIICSLDPKDAFSKLSFARSKYEGDKSIYFAAANKLKVYEELYKMKAIAQSKIQEARYEAESNKQKMEASLSELDLARSYLDKTNIFAPSNGILAEKIIQAGGFVTQQDVVVKFISAGDALFEIDVPEKEVEKIKIGMKVKVNCDAYPNQVFEGLVKEIAPIVQQRTRTAIIKVAIPNKEGLLRSGMFARGEIILLELEEAILVPLDSVINLGTETKLIPLVKPDNNVPNRGIIELRHVKVGQTVEKSVLVLDGLYQDELLVIETQGQLSDGLPIIYAEEVPVQDIKDKND